MAFVPGYVSAPQQTTSPARGETAGVDVVAYGIRNGEIGGAPAVADRE